MEMLPNKYTKEWLKTFKAFENVSDLEAEHIIESLLSLHSTLMALSMETFSNINNETIQQAA
jgi:hypothetical protein